MRSESMEKPSLFTKRRSMRSACPFSNRSSCERHPTNGAQVKVGDQKAVYRFLSTVPSVTVLRPPRHLHSRDNIPVPRPCDDVLQLHSRFLAGRAHRQFVHVAPETRTVLSADRT